MATPNVEPMSGIRRAAIMLLMLEEEAASEVFKHFPPTLIQKSVKK